MWGRDVDKTLRRVVRQVRTHPRLALGGASSLAAAAVAAIVGQRHKSSNPTLPAPGVIGAETATAVHNAAKGSVIRAVRVAEVPKGWIIDEAVRDAMQEAVQTGVDLVPVAVGVVEGSVEVAHLVGESPLAAGQRAAAAAVFAAEERLPGAADRIRQALAPYLEQRTEPPPER